MADLSGVPPTRLVHKACQDEGIVATPDVYRAILNAIGIYDELRSAPHRFVPSGRDADPGCRECGCFDTHSVHETGYDWRSRTTWCLRVCEICGRQASDLFLVPSCEHRMVEVLVQHGVVEDVEAQMLRAGDRIAVRVDQVLQNEDGRVELVGIEAPSSLLAGQVVTRVWG